MKRLFLNVLIILFFSTFFASISFSSNGNTWKKVNEESDIEVFLKPSPNKMLDVMKGVGLVDGSPEKIAFILLDSTQKKNWDGLQKEKVLEQKSHLNKVFYQAYEVPFPFSNRDIVFRITCEKTQDGFLIKYNSEKHSKAPKTIGERATIHANYFLKRVKGGKTLASVEVIFDLKGDVPAFISNIISRKWPISVIKHVRRKIKQSWVKEIKF
ncbi:MAG: START domain-containing protein [Bdellovibrionota bacterium]|nr:START domain-containing protein [Bdellovibrionota bacterium]MEC8624761.1 START domain-containing protein [Bdellovibrionota bacterium]